MGVNVNDLRRPWTVEDVMKGRIGRPFCVSVKEFRFDPDGNLVVRRQAPVRDGYPMFPPLSRWVFISLLPSGLNVAWDGVKWDLVKPIEKVDDDWIYIEKSF